MDVILQVKLSLILGFFLLTFKVLNNIHVGGQDYECLTSYSHTLDQKVSLFVYFNDLYYTKKPDDIWFKYDVNSNKHLARKNEPYITKEMKMTMNIEEFHLVRIPLNEIYSDKVNEEFTLPQYFIAIGMCPVYGTGFYKNYKFFGDYKNPGFWKNLYNSMKCSLGRCDIGYLIGDYWHDAHNNAHVFDGFYIYFDPGPNNLPLVFYGPEYGELTQYLTSCPYINWVDRYNHMEFVPEYYVKEDFFQLEEDYNRHRLVPVFEGQRPKTLYNNMKNIVNSVFKCGTLVQNIPNTGVLKVDVVLNLRKAKYIHAKSGHELFKQNNRFHCLKWIDITDEIIYGVIFKDNTYKNEKNEVFHHTGFLKFYSGQRIYVYSKDQIMKDRKEHLRSSAQYNYDRTYFEENFISYELLCRGYVRDIDTILRLRIDNDVIFPTKDNSGNMDEYRIDHSKHIGKFIRCGALSPKYNYDRIYKDFYEYKFMTKIKKIKDVYGRNVIGCFQERRKIVHSEQDLYGTYECITEPTSDKIKSSTFIILPGKQTYSNSTLKRPLNDKLFYSCNLYDEKYFHIYEMHVKFPNKEPIIYTLFGRENLDFKIIENHYIRYTPNPKTIESENAEVTCYYNLNGTDGSIIKYHYEHH